jgi:two-component system, LuxR family, response regulator FixJ
MPMITGPVIVVDDDDAVRQSLKFALDLEGLSVRLYRDGHHFLAEDDLPPTGCLVVDYRMAGIDGIELVKRLRARRVHLPAILITTKCTPGLLERARRVGFRQVLEKPLEDGSLLEGIRGALAVA